MDDHPSAPAVETVALLKTFGATRAVDGLDLVVPRGGVYGLLGPNGAGKTTTVRLLASLLRPDGGHARVLGHDVVVDAAAVRRDIALTGQFASVDTDLTGAENLVLQARLLGHSRRSARARADELLTAFGLGDAAGRLVGTYSGGMQRGSTWRRASYGRLGCCSSTNPRPASTRAAAARSGTSSASWSTGGARCC